MSIGTTLRAAREGKGLTISYVAELTNIMVRTIEDLESDNFKRIAAPIYGRGFIKLYAGVLGLDPAPLLDQYNAIVEGPGQSAAEPPPQKPPRTVRPLQQPKLAEQPPITARPPVVPAAPADEKTALARILEQRMAEEKHAADLILVKPGAVAPEQPGGLHGVTMTEEEPADDGDAFSWEGQEEPEEAFEETEPEESPLHGVVVSEEEPEPVDAFSPAAFSPEEPQPVRFPVKAPMPIEPMPEEIPLVIEQTTPAPPAGEPDLFTIADERKKNIAQSLASPLAQAIPPAGPDRSKLFSRQKNAPIFKPRSADDRDEPVEREGGSALAKIGGGARTVCVKVIDACGMAWDACRKRCGGDRVLMRPDSFKKVVLIASVACAVLLVGIAIYFTSTHNPDAAATETKPAAAPAAESVQVREIKQLAPPPAPYFD